MQTIVAVKQMLRAVGKLAPPTPEAAIAALSPQETRVFWMMLEDRTMKSIACELQLSPKTIDTYKAGILRKLDLDSRIGLLFWAIRAGLIKP